MGCKCAKVTDEYHGWECDITEGACVFLNPDSKKCDEMYGEGPDAHGEETCATCEYWLEKYQKCENPEQPQSEADDYMSPPNKTCDLWESHH